VTACNCDQALALQARVAELEAENARLKSQLQNWKDWIAMVRL
jgi:FtsZ-binding cell division protein ZapB